MSAPLLIVLIVALKFLLPLFFFVAPFPAGWANFFLDSVDGALLIPAGLADSTYQNVDKAADWFTYLCIFVWGWKRPIRREIAVTFALRTVGQTLFFLTQREIVFFWFPNLLEPLFLVWISLARLKGADAVAGIYRRRWRWIWLGILLYKFQDEWFTHVANVDRTEFFRSIF